jgi:hypothetical protein
MPRALAALLLVTLAACPTADAPAHPDAGAAVHRVVSEEVLARAPVTSRALVKHILVSWEQILRSGPRRPPDPRALGRTREQAESLTLDLLDRARRGDDFNKLMSQFSEDEVTARMSAPLEVRPDGRMDPAFQALALRLNVGEVGVCQTVYGLHVVKRVE